MITNLDRVAINRALAKAMAFQNCGDWRKAEAWAAVLVDLLGQAAILTPAAFAATKNMEG